MSQGRGCFKNGCFGCLGLLLLFLVFIGINAVIAVSRSGDTEISDQVLNSETSTSTEPLADAQVATTTADKPDAGHGWLILELGQGEFEIHPGKPGAGVVVKANYDASTYELEEYSHTWADSAWVYQVRFRRTISGLQALLGDIMGHNQTAKLHVFVPPDLPVELKVLVSEGGLEAELGGLWLTDMDLRYHKGGIQLSIDQPLREPLGTLAIHGRMGGGDISGLGNASPQILDVTCTMGGMALGLGGTWVGDCDANISLAMGGMDVNVPDSITLELDGESKSGMTRTDVEVQLPVLRVRQQVKMGEIEIR